MTDLVAEPADATPFTEAERQGLLLPVLTRAELNRAEAENIVGAMSWLVLSNRRAPSRVSAARYDLDECAIRFGYRLVVIHPFPNGNGRWSRLVSAVPGLGTPVLLDDRVAAVDDQDRARHERGRIAGEVDHARA
jgi:fido (protein-threonine AMPylation protein)